MALYKMTCDICLKNLKGQNYTHNENNFNICNQCFDEKKKSNKKSTSTTDKNNKDPNNNGEIEKTKIQSENYFPQCHEKNMIWIQNPNIYEDKKCQFDKITCHQ